MNILRKILAFVAIMLPMMVGAQSINVKSFEYDPANVTALNNPVNDNMGKPCALIIVHYVGSGGFRFNLNAWYKVETATIDGEKVYLIWLADGTNTMSISNDDSSIEPLKNYHFQRVRGTRVYDMVLETITKPTTSQQFLKFKLSPENATLVVDGLPWAVNNGAAHQLVKLGKHRYEVSAPGYHTDINTVTMDTDEAMEVRVTLQPRFGFLDVKLGSDFSDANVFIDNAVIGLGSIKGHKLDSGTYTLMVMHPMYTPYSTTVTISDNQTTTISPHLTANFANMVLQCNDKEATIYVDSQEVGKDTYRGRMTIGNHTIETRRAGHKSAMQNIEIASAADSRTIALQAPTPIYGSLTIESNPSDATLTIDGKTVGTTPYHSERIIIGDHQIGLSHTGYTDHAQTVTITQTTPIVLSLSLKERAPFDPDGTFADNLKAAEAGNPAAQYWVGKSYYLGTGGVSQNYCDALNWWRKAAEQGYAAAQNGVGLCYEFGYCCTGNKEAVEWYTKAAEQGYAAAINNLGWCYEKGKGVQQNWDKAIELYTKAAEQGQVNAQYNLGKCYYNGKGVTKDINKAKYWYQKAADQGFKYAIEALENMNMFDSKLKAAKTGDPEAQYWIGEAYLYAENGVSQDYAKAVEWCTKAAKQGHAGAQCMLGFCYANGDGVTQNKTKALEWWTKAAQQGDVGAQFNLGVSYYNGEGVVQSYTKAVEWYTKAAEQGQVLAQFNLGSCFEYGEGVAKDLDKAKYWYQKAADQGFIFAKDALERLR